MEIERPVKQSLRGFGMTVIEVGEKVWFSPGFYKVKEEMKWKRRMSETFTQP